MDNKRTGDRPVASSGKRAGKQADRVDEIRVAKLVTSVELDLIVLDLRRNITDLAARIRQD